MLWRLGRWAMAMAVACAIVGSVAIGVVYWRFSQGLPDHKQLIDYQPPTTTRLYAGDGRLMAEYAREKRVFIPASAMPRRVLEAFVAAEDQRFFTHPGIDAVGVLRAVVNNLAHLGSGRRPEGGSSITQQVAKNFLLGNEQTLARKIREAILALRIENTFSKDRILELYLNEIYLGGGSYGAGAAALNYFGKPLDELTLSEIAYLAALPKAPNLYNIARNPQGAHARRDYVIGRMLDDGYIRREEADAARAETLQLRRRPETEVVTGADFFSEEVRRNLMAAYGEKGLYEGGLTVRTTLDPDIQRIADEALRTGLIAYDRRHGWRGPRERLTSLENWKLQLAQHAEKHPVTGMKAWMPAVVLKVDNTSAQIGHLNGEGTIPFAEAAWARPTLEEQRVGAPPQRMQQVLAPGDVVVVEPVERPAGANARPYAPNTFALRQVPNIEGGVIVMDPQTGRVLALSGGWDYRRSQYNRAVQAQRQPGSSFKPFVYLAAMDAGMTPSTLVLDAPFVFDPGHGQPIWRPQNYGGDYLGPMTIRNGLEKSRNLMTVRMAKEMGMRRVVDVAKKFGVVEDMKPYLPMSLGAGETTLLRMAMGYSMLANGARPIIPSLVDRVQDRAGKTIYRHDPRSCVGCEKAAGLSGPEIADSRQPVYDQASVYQVVHMMMGVTTRGTAGQLARLNRPIAGKTGTTNDSRDVWFMGFTPDLVVGAYIGFDEPRTLGQLETGGGAAVPIFEQIIEAVYRGKPPTPFPMPPGLRLVRVNPASGQLAGAGDAAIWEAFKPGTEPGSGGGIQALEGVNTWDPSAADETAPPASGALPSVSIGPSGVPGAVGLPPPLRGPRPSLSGTGETY